LWKNKGSSTCNLYASQEVLEHLTKFEPNLITIDAPLGLPKKGPMRKANRERYMRAQLIGDGEEGYIAVPTKGDGRRLKL
jgi:predicted nuclease with RNAse H fold